MFQISRKFIKVQNELYEVVRVFQEDKILNADLLKNWLDVEIIFKKDSMLYFCNRVQELEVINN
jgi:hypothetical protein